MSDDPFSPAAVFETTWWEYVDVDGGNVIGFHRAMFREIATGRVAQYIDLPTGALFAARREYDQGRNDYPRLGPDGLSIIMKMVDGHLWHIEGRASNCTMKDDDEHRCWVRHGTVGENVTVDKNGLTCAAGAGSFFMGPNNEWHGFLRDGKLTP